MSRRATSSIMVNEGLILRPASVSFCSKLLEAFGNPNEKFPHHDQQSSSTRRSAGLALPADVTDGPDRVACGVLLDRRQDLDKHKRGGAGSVDLPLGGFAGHPACRFCRKCFYDEGAMYHHMQSAHETCHLCRRAAPDKFVYYRDYDELERQGVLGIIRKTRIRGRLADGVPMREGEKMLHLIRHGQGFHNLLGDLYRDFGKTVDSTGGDKSGNPYVLSLIHI